MSFLAIRKFFKAIPLWAYLLVAAGIAVWWYGNHRESQGEQTVQTQWDTQKKEDATLIARLKEQAGKITTVVQTKIEYRDRIITEKGQDRVRIQKVFVPTDSGYLAGGFRLYHDAASTNTIPDPAAIPDAAPVAVTDVASTIETNYQLCHKAYSRVEGWQDWATKQCALNANGCPPNG